MDFREYAIARDGDEIVVSGTIREPVNWDFTIRINGDDIPGMLRLGLHRHTLAMAARWVLRRPATTAKGREAPAVASRTVPTGEPPPTAPDPDPAPAPAPAHDVQVRAFTPMASVGPRTADFGVPRRRGGANGHVPTEVRVQGGQR